MGVKISGRLVGQGAGVGLKHKLSVVMFFRRRRLASALGPVRGASPARVVATQQGPVEQFGVLVTLSR
jgi:hypothetical protein